VTWDRSIISINRALEIDPVAGRVCALSRHRWPRDRAATTGTHDPGEPLFHIGAQDSVPGKLGNLGTPGRPLGMPLNDGRAIIQGAAARLRITSDFAGYREGGTTKPASDLLQTLTLDEQQRDVLALHQ
jgi:hypothetical protein